MKIYRTIWILSIALVLMVGGCDLFKPKEKATTPPPIPEEITPPPSPVIAEPSPPSEVKVVPPKAEPKSDSAIPIFYQYDKVQEYTYKTTSTYQGITSDITTTTKISPDTFEGKAAWLTEAEVETQGVQSKSKVWVDKATQKCLKIQSETTAYGQSFKTDSECPEYDPTRVEIEEKTGKPVSDIIFVGKEPVTVPAGTFEANKYTMSSANIQYWIGSDVPIPLKMTYDSDGASSSTVLVSYK